VTCDERVLTEDSEALSGRSDLVAGRTRWRSANVPMANDGSLIS
jgi:hypothetical protein